MKLDLPTRPLAIMTGVSRQRGIGAAICHALAQAGTDVFFTHWSPYDSKMPWGAEEDEPAHLQRQLQDMGVRCEHLEIDLSMVNAPQQILDTAELCLVFPSILINNATHDDTDALFGQLDGMTLDAYYAVNMRGTILLSVEFARRFPQPADGRIINCYGMLSADSDRVHLRFVSGRPVSQGTIDLSCVAV